MSEVPAAARLRLSCRPAKVGNSLVFPYRLANEGPGEVYAMHALPGGGAAADESRAVVIADDEGNAIIGKFAPPLPTDRRIAMPIVPLARRLPAGAGIDGRIEIALPLAETSPYFPDLTLRQYQILEISGVVLTIAYWPADPSEVTAAPATVAPDLLSVRPVDPAARPRFVTQRFPTHGLQLFRRTDAFPRRLG